jgi:hypothetical protein
MLTHRQLDTQKQVLLYFLLPILIFVTAWAATTQRFELRRRAASTEPSVCTPIANTIVVTPVGGAGTCHDLQTAIDSAPNGTTEPFIIHLTPGTYYIPESGTSFSINIYNRSLLQIEGEYAQGSRAVHLKFLDNRGGFRVENSQNIFIGWMQVDGKTANGMMSFRNSNNVTAEYIHLADTGAHTFDMSGGSTNSLSNCEVASMADAVEVGGVSTFTVSNCVISNAHTGISINSATNGSVIGNTIFTMYDNGIRASNSSFTMQNNTIANNGTNINQEIAGLYVQNYSGGTSTITMKNNLIVFNNKYGIGMPSLDGTTIIADHNDIYGNQLANTQLYQYPNGINGNINADPLFGADYCLLPNSPAIYGDINAYEYMGSKSSCSGSPTPTPLSTNVEFDVALKLGGVTDNKATGSLVTIRFINGQTNLVTPPIPLEYTNDGIYLAKFNISTGQLPPGSGYTMIVKGEKHVARKFCKQTGQTEPCLAYESFTLPIPTSDTWTNAFNLTGMQLDPGDLYAQDGKANSDDFNKIKTLMSVSCSDLTAQDKLIADLDYNGCVNISDAYLMRKTLETRYDEN